MQSYKSTKIKTYKVITLNKWKQTGFIKVKGKRCIDQIIESKGLKITS